MADLRALLVAAGGHGRVVADAWLASGFSLEGVVDPAVAVGAHVFGLTVLGDDLWLDRQRTHEFGLLNGVGVVPRSDLRQRLFETRKSQGFAFMTIRHPSAVIGSEVALSEGCQVMAGSVLQCRVSLGENAVVNTRASIDHDCVIGAHSFIGPGAVLCGAVEVGDAAFLGAGCVVLPGVRIGTRAVVGAGAVVTRDVGDGVYVFGNPARRKN
jgi:sugar O-acyltransferase (sialic acid O-acetyltransferase NeuD family)